MAELVFVSGNGAYRDANVNSYFVPFEKETGIHVRDPITSPGLPQVLEWNRKGTLNFDIASMSESSYRQYSRQGLLEAIDYDLFDKSVLEELDPEACQQYGVANLYAASVLGYDTEVFPEDDCPKTWKDFWDIERFSGLRCLEAMRGAEGTLEQALMADGVSMDRLYPLDVDRGFKNLDEIKPYVYFWWFTGDQAVQLLLEKAVTMTFVWYTRIQVLKDFGFPIDFTWNQAALITEYYALPKGAKNYKEAMRFLSFVSQDKQQAEHTKHIYSAPVNQSAYRLIPEQVQRKLCSWPENRDQAFEVDAQWWEKNGSGVAERAKSWMQRP
jgi:putative spermidine/putrescine transport system substrate-binding protein